MNECDDVLEIILNYAINRNIFLVCKQWAHICKEKHGKAPQTYAIGKAKAPQTYGIGKAKAPQARLLKV